MVAGRRIQTTFIAVILNAVLWNAFYAVLFESFSKTETKFGFEGLMKLFPTKHDICPSWNPSELPPRFQNVSSIVEDSGRLFIAINLYNNEDVFPDMVQSLVPFLTAFQKQDVFVSIYENGSSDNTKTLLYVFEQILESLSIPHRIRFSYEKKDPNAHRIEYLADVRNKVLEPLYNAAKPYSTVLFLNDIYICTHDLFEMLLQYRY